MLFAPAHIKSLIHGKVAANLILCHLYILCDMSLQPQTLARSNSCPEPQNGDPVGNVNGENFLHDLWA